MENLSLYDIRLTPGTILKEKNNSTEYILQGYDYTGNNLICLSTENSLINKNIHIIKVDDIDKIIKHKITKEHLKNYFNYLFTQANDYINKKS